MRTITIAATAFLTLSACAGTLPLSSTMNEADKERLSAAHYYAFAGTLSRQAVWANTATSMGGTVRTLEEFLDPATGLRCRKFVERTRATDGRSQERTGTACEQADGNLEVTFDNAVEE